MKLRDLVTAERPSELRRAPNEALVLNKMSIFKQQKRLWFLAGAGFSGLGLFTLEVRHLCKSHSEHAALLPYCAMLSTIVIANLFANPLVLQKRVRFGSERGVAGRGSCGGTTAWNPSVLMR